MDSRKRSRIVLLTLVGLPLGAVGIASMMPAGKDMRRNLYSDRGACERDYNREQCEPNSTTSSSSSGGNGGGYVGGYRGPAYYANRSVAEARSDPGPGRTGQITPTQASTRGGFGGIGRALSAAS